jgi:putative acetyltransferase
MRICEAKPAEIDAVVRVERLAFRRDDEPRFVAELLRDPTARPSLSLLAYDGPKPVGHALFTRAQLAGSSRNIDSALLAPLAVVPPFQRQGVGRALIERGADTLATAGVRLLFVLGEPAYYTRCRFVPAIPLGLDAPYPIVPAEAWMVRALAPGLLGITQGTVAVAASLRRPEYWRE